MVGEAVKFVSPAGAECDALVLHEYPGNPNATTADARCVNLVIVADASAPVGHYGRATRIVEGVPHRDAENNASPRGRWHAVGE